MATGVVIVPGFNGSRLVYNRPDTRCTPPRQQNAALYVPPLFGNSQHKTGEWVASMRADLRYDRKSGDVEYQVSNGAKVYRDPPHNLDSVRDLLPFESLDRYLPSHVADALNDQFSYRYMSDVIDAAHSVYGTDGVTAVPYDFRKVFESDTFHAFQREFCHACESRGKTHVVAHSLGGMLVYHALVSKGNPWVRDHIESLTLASVPWGGVASLIKAIISGYYYIPSLKAEYGQMVRNYSGFAACLPNRYGFPEGMTVALDRSSGNAYACNDASLYELCAKVQADTANVRTLLFPQISAVLSSFEAAPLDTRVTCVYSGGRPTELSFEYEEISEGMQNDPVQVLRTQGDGLVTFNSLCSMKRLQDAYTYVEYMDDRVGHTNLLSYLPFLDLLQRTWKPEQ